MKQKKSIQLSQAFGAVLSIVLVAVLVIIAIVIFVQLATSFAGTSTVNVINETGGWLNQTAYTLDASTQCQVAGLSVTEAFNETSATVISAANLSIDTTAFTITSVDFFLNSSNVSYSYTYTWGSGACDASENLTTEFGNYTSLIGLVGTIIFLGLVIGVLVTSFAFGGGGRREV